MAEPAPTRSTIANELEETAMAVLKSVGPLTADRDKLPYAQAFATMALSQRLAALNEILTERLSDDLGAEFRAGMSEIADNVWASLRKVREG